jgi:hypothetical protein
MEKNLKEREKEEKLEKIKMAIWIYNKLIDNYPYLYEAMKKAYREEKYGR